MKIRIRVLELGLVTFIAVLSWFVMFCLECYYFGADKELQKVHSKGNQPPFPDHLADNVFWLLQITDIHFSTVNNLSIADSLHLFCHDVIKAVHPSLVLVSGDLTHAKFKDELISQQFLSEWKAYHDVLQKCDLGHIPWLDIRGNHDDFNVPSFFDSTNFFIEYSRSWKDHKSRSYSYSHHTRFGTYNFIALDACPDPGPKRPYNFFGILHMEDLISLRSFSNKVVNHTVWFTHYPSATISTDHHELRALMSTSIAHVCGHLHTLGGLMPKMYGRHPSGHLELELGDFRDSKRFRLMAFDHDLFSFVDTTLGVWPLVLVTNPKDARFLAPSREPTERMSKSSHIRILVFSTVDIESVELELDGSALPVAVAVNGGPLYVSPWQPSVYAFGLHDLKVIAQDVAGRKTIYTHKFSLDGTLLAIEKLPHLLLLTDLHSLFRLMFFFVWLALLSVLFLTWISQSDRSYFINIIRTKVIFYPYLICVVYFGLGPWYVGEITSGVYGFVCVHGIYVMGRFLPGSMTYLHGMLQIMLVYVPLLYYLNCSLSRNIKTCCWWLCTSVAVFCMLVQILWGLTAYPYGYIALLLSPGGTWPLVLTLWLIYRTLCFN